MPFKIKDHTADIALEIKAKTLPQLFEEAGFGYLFLLIENQKCIPREFKTLKVEGENTEDLLVSFLSQLSFIFETKKKIPCSFEAIRLKEKSLTAKVGLTPYHPKKHIIQHDIKAITYHQLNIEKTKGGFQVTIIFDI